MLGPTGAAIDVVGDGREAVRAAARGRYDAVLMDIQMPLFDGHAATREIRREERRAGRRPVPIVAVSANALATDRQASRDAGCDAHLEKPLDKATLLTTLSGILGAAPAPPDLDRASALNRLGGDRTLYAKVCASAAGQMAAWRARFDDAVNARDAPTCRRLAHDLKSTAGTVGALALQQAAGALEERLLMCGDDDSAGVADAHAAVLQTLDVAREQLKSIAE